MREPALSSVGCYFIKESVFERQLSDLKIRYEFKEKTDLCPAKFLVFHPVHPEVFIECSCLFGSDFLDDSPFAYEDSYILWGRELSAALTLWGKEKIR